MHAAIGATEDADLSKFSSVDMQPGLHGVFADFRGDETKEELSNIVHSAVSNVAHFKDHLRGWARRNHRGVKLIDEAITGSRELRIVIDLADTDKHGGMRRDCDYSKLNPRISGLEQALRMRTRPVVGSGVGLTLSGGALRVVGDGSGAVEITGSVVAEDGTVLGDLREIVVAAVSAWEVVLETFGLSKDSMDSRQS